MGMPRAACGWSGVFCRTIHVRMPLCCMRMASFPSKYTCEKATCCKRMVRCFLSDYTCEKATVLLENGQVVFLGDPPLLPYYMFGSAHNE